MNNVQIIKSILYKDYYIIFKDGERKGSIKRSESQYILTLYYKVNFTVLFETLTEAIQYAIDMIRG